MVAYLNRSSPNRDLARHFLEHYVLTDEGLTAIDQVKPIGVPALVSLYDTMAETNALVRELKAAVDHGEVMPNIPQMGRFFSSLGAALQIATDRQASAREALLEAARAMRHQ